MAGAPAGWAPTTSGGRPESVEGDGDARDEPTPADGDDHDVGSGAELLHHLQGDGALAGDGGGMVEGGDHGGTGLRRVGGRGAEGVVEGVAGEAELDELPGQGPDAGHLLAGRALG